MIRARLGYNRADCDHAVANPSPRAHEEKTSLVEAVNLQEVSGQLSPFKVTWPFSWQLAKTHVISPSNFPTISSTWVLVQKRFLMREFWLPLKTGDRHKALTVFKDLVIYNLVPGTDWLGATAGKYSQSPILLVPILSVFHLNIKLESEIRDSKWRKLL